MKEVIIKYKDLKVLALLKSLARYLDFSVSERDETKKTSKKKGAFPILHVKAANAKHYKFNRNEANER